MSSDGGGFGAILGRLLEVLARWGLLPLAQPCPVPVRRREPRGVSAPAARARAAMKGVRRDDRLS